MKSKSSDIENLSEKQKAFLTKLNTETLSKIFHNREKALEYARKGIIQTMSERSNDEIADYMQVLARIVLEERGILTKD